MSDTDEVDPIIEAVEKFVASIPAADFEAKPLMLAFLNWFRSQDIDRADMCSAMATLVGMFVGMIADDAKDLEKGLAIYARQIRGTADVVVKCRDGWRS